MTPTLNNRLLTTARGRDFLVRSRYRSGNGVLLYSAVGCQKVSFSCFPALADGYRATALHVTSEGQRMRVQSLWRDHRLGVAFGNLLLLGDNRFYLSRGYTGPSVLTAVDIKTGQIRWSSREF